MMVPVDADAACYLSSFLNVKLKEIQPSSNVRAFWMALFSPLLERDAHCERIKKKKKHAERSLSSCRGGVPHD